MTYQQGTRQKTPVDHYYVTAVQLSGRRWANQRAGEGRVQQ